MVTWNVQNWFCMPVQLCLQQVYSLGVEDAGLLRLCTCKRRIYNTVAGKIGYMDLEEVARCHDYTPARAALFTL